MSDRRADDTSIAPRRSLSGSDPASDSPAATGSHARSGSGGSPLPPGSQSGSRTSGGSAGTPGRFAPTSVQPAVPRVRQPREARLRLTQVDPWSVTKMAFLLSIALGVVLVVAVAVVWAVLGAAGLWDSINSAVQETIGDSTGKPFEIQDYVGTSRVLGFTMIVAVVDIVLITMIATLGAFLYNLAATLLGGVEVTLAEED